jgi:hypothetical protein
MQGYIKKLFFTIMSCSPTLFVLPRAGLNTQRDVWPVSSMRGTTSIHGWVVEKREPNKFGVSGLINRSYLAMCSEILRRLQNVMWTDSLEIGALLRR